MLVRAQPLTDDSARRAYEGAGAHDAPDDPSPSHAFQWLTRSRPATGTSGSAYRLLTRSHQKKATFAGVREINRHDDAPVSSFANISALNLTSLNNRHHSLM